MLQKQVSEKMQNTKLKCAIVYAEKSVKTLAEETGIHEQTIRRAINNRNITVSNAIKIAHALGCYVEDVFSINDNKGE